ncbi:helix-turn-helix transcriptional regulator [Bacillus sp. LL01]|uniref:helix-turn-helix domain-containing protein n=1 Tax=Bacillus sp. LL01 TaxID=1665556 RepID=UPI00069FEB00|nr:helix-turn-helix transcriptional regulator [Bacillus sp. LL01]
MKDLAQYLKELRGKKSIRKVSQEIGISHTYLSTLERGFDPRTKKERKPTPDVLRKLSNYYNVPYIALMDMAGYVDSEGAVQVDSFFDLMGIPPREIEKSKKEGTIIGVGSSGLEHIKANNNKTFDIYSILKMNADVFFKDKELNQEDKEFLITLLERTFNK